MRKVWIFVALLALLALSACGKIVPAATATPEPTVAPTAAAGEVSTTPTEPCSVVNTFPTPRTFEEVNLAPITAEDHAFGPEDAMLTLVEYSDFQCPYCGLAYDELEKAMAKYPGKIRLIFRNFPLSIHDKANLAAQAAEAAGLQGKFWEMYHIIFNSTNRTAWAEMTTDDFTKWVTEQAATVDGLDAAKFATDMVSDTVVKMVQDSYTEATTAQLGGTPSFYFIINGKLYFTPEDQVPYDVATLGLVMDLFALNEMQYTSCPEMTIDPSKTYTATVKTDQGDFTMELYPKVAPLAVNNFVFLAREGWYNNVTWHRVLTDFVAQTGDPTGSGAGGPGYFFINEISADLKFDKEGVVGMANSGADRNGSQFFITYAAAPTLDGSYTIFGQVTSGMDVVKKLTPRDPSAEGELPEGSKIISITINEK